jgi:phosphoglycolate phosphatase
MAFKAIIFDMDGTLLDTLADLADSMNQVLKRFGFPEHPREAYKYFVGQGMDILVRKALPPEHRNESLITKSIEAMREEYSQNWDRTTHPYPGIPELLEALTQRGIPMTILSNKPHDFTQFVADRLLAQWTFPMVLGARPGVPKKPDPAGALEIAEALKLSPQEFLYLGDTGTDMQTATAAGMYPVGALWGFRTASELTAEGAKVLISQPQDLLKFI